VALNHIDRAWTPFVEKHASSRLGGGSGAAETGLSDALRSVGFGGSPVPEDEQAAMSNVAMAAPSTSLLPVTMARLAERVHPFALDCSRVTAGTPSALI
jgi:hypothetical protein